MAINLNEPRSASPSVTFRVPRWVVWSAPLVLVAILVSYRWIDRPLSDALNQMPKAGKVATEWVTELGHSKYYFIGLPILIALLLWRGRRRWAMRAGLFLGSVALAGLAAPALKVIFGRYRPEAWWDHGHWGFDLLRIKYEHGSFPSGHASVSGALMMAACLVAPRFWPMFVVLGGTVAFTRVMTGSHFLSDVIAGLYLGMLSAVLMRHELRKHRLYPPASVDTTAPVGDEVGGEKMARTTSTSTGSPPAE